MIGVTVYGIPAPQGSKRHVGNGVMVESSAKVKPWREAVKYAALEAVNGAPPMLGPLEVEVLFYLPRPKSIRAGARPWRRPDLDKLVRSTFDALTDASVWGDDSQVVSVKAEKVYAEPGADTYVRPGASITIWEMSL